jgi:hypothetical protein
MVKLFGLITLVCQTLQDVTNLKGHHFGTLTNVQTAATQALNTLTVEEWKNHWERCVHSQGSYFEDHINL